MLETIREYAAQFVDDELRGRHAEYFVELMEEAFPNVLEDPHGWLLRLDDERANFRIAFEFLMDAGETQRALQLVGALGRFWYLHGDSGEGKLAIDRALAADTRPTAERARALHSAAVLLVGPGETAPAVARATDALELSRELGDDWGVAYSVFLLGNIAIDSKDWELAREYFLESGDLFDALGRDHFRMLTKFNLAWVYANLGDKQSGRRLLDEIYREASAAGNKRIFMLALGAMSEHRKEDGDIPKALELLRQGFALAQETGDRTEMVDVLSRVASALAAADQFVPAARVLGKVMHIYDETGGLRSSGADRDAATLALVKANLDDAAFERAWNEGPALSEDEALEHSRFAE